MTNSTQKPAFNIGDNVTVINGYGLHTKGFQVTGVKLNDANEYEYKINWDCDWVLVEADRLIAEKPCLIEEIGGEEVAKRLLKKYADYDRVDVAIDKEQIVFVPLHKVRALMEQRGATA